MATDLLVKDLIYWLIMVSRSGALSLFYLLNVCLTIRSRLAAE